MTSENENQNDRAVAAELRLEDLHESDVYTSEHVITGALVDAFAALFGDYSPLHVDDDFARARGFAGRVAHGTILNGFVSRLVGMVVPGRRALLMSVDLRYVQPIYLHDRVRLAATISQVHAEQRTIALTVQFDRIGADASTTVARGRVMVRVTADE